MIEAAQKYTSLGFSALPMKQDKRPGISRWTERQKAIITPNGEFDDSYGIALICGKVSGGLECIDIDTQYDLTGSLYQDYTKEINNAMPGLLDKLIIQQTPSGGYHFIYRYSAPEGNLKLARRNATEEERKKGEKVHPLIETRGEGGYFGASPTPGYKLIVGDFEFINQITDIERDTLFSIARSFNQVFTEAIVNNNAISKNYTGKSPFNDYNEHGDVLELLQAHGWTIAQVQGTNTRLKRPGITDSPYGASYSSKLRLFYVFTTSSDFDHDKAYKPVAVFCKLEAGDDWKKCVTMLLDKGFGERQTPKGEHSIQQPDIPMTKEDIFAKYEHCKIGADRPIPEPVPIYKIHNIPVGTRGSLSSIMGLPKSGKTAIPGVIISRLIETSNGGDTPTEIAVYNPDMKAIIAVDTEQSNYHHYKNTQRILRRARIEKEPAHLYNYNIRRYSISEQKQFINDIFFAANEKHGGICLAVIDGIADFISSVNDEEEANVIVDFFDKLAIQYDCHIIVVIHFNPGTGKGRGHLGSQLERKSESVLTIKRDGDMGIIEAMYLRSGGNADFIPLHFTFDKDKGYHVFLQGDYTNNKGVKLQQLATFIFTEELRSKDAVKGIMEHENCTGRTAKTRLEQLEAAGLIIKRKGPGIQVFYSLIK